MSRAVALCRKDLFDIYSHAIESIRPEIFVKSALSISRASTGGSYVLTIRDRAQLQTIRKLDLKGTNLHVIGGGKSTLAMASGLAQVAMEAEATSLFSFGALSLPVGLEHNFKKDPKLVGHLKTIGVSCLFGSANNLPDESSVSASKSILDIVTSACDRARVEKNRPLFIVLISGGGSACLTSPKYIDLKQKLNLTKFLVQRGATIVELNKVRRYFSSVKGGRLASYILNSHPQSQILTLIVSDVIEDPIEFIASGPTNISSDNEDHRHQMLSVLMRYGYNIGELLEGVNTSEELPLDFTGRSVFNYIIGNNSIALSAAIDKAKLLGYKVESMGSTLQGNSEQIVKTMLEKGSEVSNECNDDVLIIGGGEATINKRNGESWGMGGRAQEMALDYMIDKILSETPGRELKKHDVFLAGSTDGQDGPTDVSACMASFAEWKLQKSFSLDEALKAKQMHDSYNFWTKHNPNWLIKTGLTGTNVMDLYMYLVSNK